jgi:hypothetical protein
MLTRILICILMLMRMLSIMLVLVLFSSLLVRARLKVMVMLLMVLPPLLLLALTRMLSSLARPLSRLYLYAAAPICNFTSTFVPDLAHIPYLPSSHCDSLTH